MKSEPRRDAEYQLVVSGELDERFSYLFEGMQMTRTEGTTVLAGPVRDQAHLYGLIERVEGLGLELLSVQQIDTSPPSATHERDEA
jgi:hypothetical protein